MTQSQISFETLEKIGFSGQDLSTIEDELKGKPVNFTVESRTWKDKPYYEVKYLNASRAPEALDKNEIFNRMKAQGIQSAAPAAMTEESAY